MSPGDVPQLCPMCGEPVAPAAESCAACGERLTDDRPPLHVSDHFLLNRFQSQMNGLAGVWYVAGGFVTAAMASVWIAALLEGKLPGVYWMYDVYQGSLIDALITAFGLLFLLMGVACRRRQEWGLYASFINGYCGLALNLLLYEYFSVCGFILVIPILILCHFTWRTALQLKRAGIRLDQSL